MKTFNVQHNDKTYTVTAKDAEHATTVLAQVLKVRDELIHYRGAIIEKASSSTRPYMIDGFGESYATIDDAKRAVDDLIRQGFRFTDSYKDVASSRTTIEALISDEKAAVDAYNVALKNEDGKLDEKSIAVIRAIRDDEERHLENLYAILSGNVTEKNLEDSVKDEVTTKERIGAYIFDMQVALRRDDFLMIANLCEMTLQQIKRS